MCALIASALAQGCTLDSLWGLDAPRPSLAERDSFEVDPLCLDHIVDQAAVAPVPTYVTLTGKRGRTGLGAEGVPVTVTRGSCAEAPDADAAPPPAPQQCDRGARPLDQRLVEEFELVENGDEACERRSRVRMDCTLDARGEASFGVVSRLREEDLLYGGYVPICVTPLAYRDALIDAGTSSFQAEVWVLPRTGTARVALATVRVAEPDIRVKASADASAAEPDCGDFFDCGSPRARASFQAGFVSADIPPDALQARDFLPVRTLQQLRPELVVVSPPETGGADAQEAFLSLDDSCQRPPPPPLTLEIEQGSRASRTFYLCASGYRGVYTAVARSTLAAPDAGPLDEPDGGVPPEQDVMDSFVVHPSEVTASAQVRGYHVVGSTAQRPVETELCGGERRPTAAGPLEIGDPLDFARDGTVVVDCGGGDDDAGGISDACTSGPLSVQLAGDDTCRLVLDP